MSTKTLEQLANEAQAAAGTRTSEENSRDAWVLELKRVCDLSPAELLREIGESV